MTTDAQIKKLGSIAKDMQGTIETLIKQHHQAVEVSMEIYRGLEKPDCLFSESPISPSRLTNVMRMYMSKLGWAWAFHQAWGVNEMKELKAFAVEVKGNAEWARRFSKDTVDKIL